MWLAYVFEDTRADEIYMSQNCEFILRTML